MADVRMFAFGAFQLIPERQLLLREGSPVSIGGRALDLLTALVQRPGEVMEKAELISFAWPTTTVDESNLKVNIGLLRRALRDDPFSAKYIATVAGRGYRFITRVEKHMLSDSKEAVHSNGLPGFDACPFPRASVWLEALACYAEDAGAARPVARARADYVRSKLRARELARDKRGSSTCFDLEKLIDVASYEVVLKGEIVIQFGEMIFLVRPGSIGMQQVADLAPPRMANCSPSVLDPQVGFPTQGDRN